MYMLQNGEKPMREELKSEREPSGCPLKNEREPSGCPLKIDDYTRPERPL